MGNSVNQSNAFFSKPFSDSVIVCINALLISNKREFRNKRKLLKSRTMFWKSKYPQNTPRTMSNVQSTTLYWIWRTINCFSTALFCDWWFCATRTCNKNPFRTIPVIDLYKTSKNQFNSPIDLEKTTVWLELLIIVGTGVRCRRKVNKLCDKINGPWLKISVGDNSCSYCSEVLRT